MKKFIFILFIFITIFSFVYAQEDIDSQNFDDMHKQLIETLEEEEFTIEGLDLLQENIDSQNFEDMHNQLVEALEEEFIIEGLDILQENNELIEEENTKIVIEQKKIKKVKKNNQEILGYLSLGLNMPFYSNAESLEKDLNSGLKGISFHYIGNIKKITFKGNLNWDYTKTQNLLFSKTISIGYSPIHNSSCFIGLYGTLGFDKIQEKTYTSPGLSGVLLYNMSDTFGVFINLDAISLKESEEKNTSYSARNRNNLIEGDISIENTPSQPRNLNTWKICPSIGFFYNFARSY